MEYYVEFDNVGFACKVIAETESEAIPKARDMAIAAIDDDIRNKAVTVEPYR
jgi:hypothetical protein